MDKELFIQNRKGQKICVSVYIPFQPKGLAFVMHGLGSNKDRPFNRTIARTCMDNKYGTISFDTTNSFGKSDGNYSDATLTNYYEDLEDVIGWAKTQSWYIEPFLLLGHSLGGISTALFTEKYPDKVKGLAPLATVVSGTLSIELPHYENIAEMKERGWIHEKRGVKLKWSHAEDRLKYDLLCGVSKLTMPILMIVGELDDSTPVQHQQILFDAIPSNTKKEFHIIKGGPHTFVEEKHLIEAYVIISDWIKSIR